MPKVPDLRNSQPPSGSKSNSCNSGEAKPTKAWNSKNSLKEYTTGAIAIGKKGGLPSR